MWVVPWKMEQVRTLTTSEMSHKDGVWMSLNTTNSIHTARRKLTLGCVIILHQSLSVLIIYWLEKVMATHSSTLAWKIPWMEEPGRLQSMGRWGSDTTERLHFHFSLSCIGEGNGNPLQGSCLENPRDGGAWWAAIFGVAQSRTRLKWLSSSSNTIINNPSAKSVNY